MKKLLVNVIKLAVTGLILYKMYQTVGADIRSIIYYILHADYLWVVGSMITQVFAITFSIIRWNVLMRAQGLEVPSSHLIKTYLVGRFLGTFTPTGVGLEAYKAYDISRYTSRPVESIAVVVVEKFLTVLSLSILVLFSLSLFTLPRAFTIIFFSIFGFLFLTTLVLVFKARFFEIFNALPVVGRKLEKPVGDAIKAFDRFKTKRSSLGVALLSGIMVYLFLFSTFFTNAKAFHVEAPHSGRLYSVERSDVVKQNLLEASIDFSNDRDAEGYYELYLTASEELILKERGLILNPKDRNSYYDRKGLYFWDAVIVGPLVQFITMIPITISGMGLREAAFVNTLNAYGIWIGMKGFAAAAMWIVVSVSINIFGAIIFLTRRTDYRTKITREEFQKATSKD